MGSEVYSLWLRCVMFPSVISMSVLAPTTIYVQNVQNCVSVFLFVCIIL